MYSINKMCSGHQRLYRKTRACCARLALQSGPRVMDNQSHQVLHASRFWRQSLEETRVPPDSEHSKSNSLPHFPSLPRGLAELSTTTPNVHDAPRVSSRESLPGDAPGASPDEKLSPKGTSARGKRPRDVRPRTLTCRDRDVLGTRRRRIRDTRSACERCRGSTWADDGPRVDGERCVHDSRCCARFFPRRRRRRT